MDTTLDTPIETAPPAPVGNPAYVSVPLRNDPGLISILGSMLGYVGVDAAKAWQSPETFHLSLCYSPDVDDKALKKVIALLKPQSVELDSAGLNVFSTPDGYALHLSLKRTDSLMALQAQVYAAFEAAGVDISAHHTPEAFNPHVTLGYFAENPVQRIDTYWWARRTSALEITRSGYKTVAVLGEETPTWRFIERFGAINPDAWFRILPIGIFERFGRKVKVTLDTVQEMAANFKRGIPDTVLPINPEHVDTEGKLGDIADVEARSDGLYILPRWLEKGRDKVAEGAFQYFSPEIVWSSDWEGAAVKNVLVGLALTNLPFFGKETAIYGLQDFVNTGSSASGGEPPNETFEGGSQLSNTDPTKVAIKEALAEYFAAQSKPVEPATEPVMPEQFKAIQDENERLKREAEAFRSQSAEVARTARVARYTALLGAEHQAQAEKFAAIADEALADELAEAFKALKAQANPMLFDEVGTGNPGETPGSDAEKFESEARRLARDEKMDLAEAYSRVSVDHPDWARAARLKSGRRQ